MIKKAGYEYLLAWKVTVPIYDYTVIFCNRYPPLNPNFPNLPDHPGRPIRPHLSSTRTHDQMVQAARSGTQNIPEGNQQASLEGYIKLTGVNKGSLEELLKDFLAFARQNKIQIWLKERAVGEIREIGEVWEILKKTPTLPDNPDFPDLPDDPEVAINLMITLLNQAIFLQNRLKASLEKKFVEKGGFKENLFKKRMEYRRNNG